MKRMKLVILGAAAYLAYTMSRPGGAGAATSGAVSTGADEGPAEQAADAAIDSPVMPQGTPGKAGWSSSGPQMVSGATGYSDFGLPTIDEAKKRDPYLDQLWDIEAESKARIREAYSIPRLRRIAQSAAAYYGVPASWVWGLLQGESNFYPVGIYKGYKGSAAGAKAARSTANGMGQMLRGRFRWEGKNWLSSSGGMAKGHSSLLDPKWGIWSVAASLGRMAKNRGGGWNRDIGNQIAAIDKMSRGASPSPKHQGSLAVGHWWAGQLPRTKPGAQKKVRQILRYGAQVYEDGKVRPSSAWQKMGPDVQEADYLPPWKTGKMSDVNKFLSQASLSALEFAAKPFWDANKGLA